MLSEVRRYTWFKIYLLAMFLQSELAYAGLTITSYGGYSRALFTNNSDNRASTLTLFPASVKAELLKRWGRNFHLAIGGTYHYGLAQLEIGSALYTGFHKNMGIVTGLMYRISHRHKAELSLEYLFQGDLSLSSLSVLKLNSSTYQHQAYLTYYTSQGVVLRLDYMREYRSKFIGSGRKGRIGVSLSHHMEMYNYQLATVTSSKGSKGPRGSTASTIDYSLNATAISLILGLIFSNSIFCIIIYPK